MLGSQGCDGMTLAIVQRRYLSHDYLNDKGNTMKPTTSIATTNVRHESDASHLIVSNPAVTKRSYPLSEIEVKPQETPSISLGDYNKANTPAGFAIQISPTSTSETVATHVTRLGTDDAHELILHITNNGDRAICAEVWEL